MKQKTCSVVGCGDEVVSFYNSKIKKKFCHEHTISEALRLSREQTHKAKQSLEIARQTIRKTPKDRFYASSAWRNFSRYVLVFYSDENFMVRCSTDPNLIYRVNDKRIAVGHYLKCDAHKSVALEFKNVAPQSVQQNIHFGGNMEAMATWIDKIHGEGTIQWLNIEKNKELHLDKLTMDEISKKYLSLLNEELKKRNKRNPWINKY